MYNSIIELYIVYLGKQVVGHIIQGNCLINYRQNDTSFLRIVKPLFALNQKQLQVHVSGFLRFDNNKFSLFSEIFFIQEQHVCF